MSLFFGLFDLENEIVPDQVYQSFCKTQIDIESEFHSLSGTHFFLGRNGKQKDSGLFASEDGRYYAVIDARLDGVGKLVSELKSSYPEVSQDTCHNLLVFKAYLVWGEECTSHLQGDFAIMVYDSELNSVWGSRDHLGIMPFFYCIRSSTMVFAQLPSIVASVVNSSINFNYIANYLAFMPTDGEYTFFEDIHTLKAGQNIRFQTSGFSVSTYYTLGATLDRSLKPDETASKLLELMSLAVKDRLGNAQIPSSMLSGGLDSSTVSCLVAREISKEDKKLHAYTYVPMEGVKYPNLPGLFVNEGPFAKKVKEAYTNIDLSLIDLKGVSIFTHLERYLKLCGALEVHNFYNWLWTQEFLIRCKDKGSTVLFSGQMGNLSISYNGRLYGLELAKKGKWKEFVNYELKTKKLKGRKVITHLAYQMFCAFAPSKLRVFVDTYISQLGSHSYNWMVKDSFLKKNNLGKRSFLKANNTFKNDRALRVQMASYIQKLAVNSKTYEQIYGVRELDPTADKRLLEFSLSIPSEYWSLHGENRYMAREMSKGLLPDEIRLNKKKGRQLIDSNLLILQDLDEIKRRISGWKNMKELSDIFEFDKVLKHLDSYDFNSYDPDFSTFLSRLIAVCLLVEMNS
ncbi:hypothetical protein AWW67_01280 [Roseivirga seohaensis]|uniref:asparagine synthase (glutamine-hydrolyzing) n=1 Tax=Roseivirga seohaensis TaxID=1914963 RepID=A0A150Y1A3_9BACT|nr:asparagine synthase-related protein [Roseivirga seohaensis]KYG84704.1 hypothetical protein AWW67_01280 [Roseivirga seohaensis]